MSSYASRSMSAKLRSVRGSFSGVARRIFSITSDGWKKRRGCSARISPRRSWGSSRRRRTRRSCSARTDGEDGEFGEDEVRAAVAARGSRMSALDDESNQFVLIHTEGALRCQAGSAGVMVEQIEAIVEASRRPNVRIGIIPWTTPVRVFCTHAFHLYDATAAVVVMRSRRRRSPTPRTSWCTPTFSPPRGSGVVR